MSLAHTLRIEWPSTPDQATILAASLSPEAGDLADDRSATEISVEGNTLQIDIEASDLIALRAAANTWMGLLQTAESAHTAAARGY